MYLQTAWRRKFVTTGTGGPRHEESREGKESVRLRSEAAVTFRLKTSVFTKLERSNEEMPDVSSCCCSFWGGEEVVASVASHWTEAGARLCPSPSLQGWVKENREGPDVLVHHVKVKATSLMAACGTDRGQMFTGLSIPYGCHSSAGPFHRTALNSTFISSTYPNRRSPSEDSDDGWIGPLWLLTPTVRGLKSTVTCIHPPTSRVPQEGVTENGLG
ncbi:hypothetical protein EYF80_018676 [Liparis tanakae]|uniref:Uncharacterized protein n=1 Tax=Liparis tanakae TaxID=230148 RepID=A0A4Z2HZD3_9TELE|nr:hypothetical protein EYF80_018676 [Liparis tanakae]